MKGVWIVTRVNEVEYWVFSSAEKAYNAIKGYIFEDTNYTSNEKKLLLGELDIDYYNYPSDFGIEDYARAIYCEVD